jgi:hypothetical protein
MKIFSSIQHNPSAYYWLTSKSKFHHCIINCSLISIDKWLFLLIVPTCGRQFAEKLTDFLYVYKDSLVCLYVFRFLGSCCWSARNWRGCTQNSTRQVSRKKCTTSAGPQQHLQTHLLLYQEMAFVMVVWANKSTHHCSLNKDGRPDFLLQFAARYP